MTGLYQTPRSISTPTGESLRQVDSKRIVERAKPHTHLQRLALGVDEARAYWRNADPAQSRAERERLAFERWWFGAKSQARVKTLLGILEGRYDAYPEGFAVLRRWLDMDPDSRRVICHWHVQLSDPIYRRFTGDFIPEHFSGRPGSTVDRDITQRWVEKTWPGKWGPATCAQFASKLLSAASEATIISSKRDPRVRQVVRVPPVAIAYLLYLLRDLGYPHDLLANPYFRSLDLTGSAIAAQSGLPGVVVHKMPEITEFQWAYSNLSAWAEGEGLVE